MAENDENSLINDDGNQVLGAVLGGMIAFDQGITNSLIDSHLDSAIDWATRFRKLYDWVQKYNRDTEVQYALDHFYWDRDKVERSIEHYESMKMRGRK